MSYLESQARPELVAVLPVDRKSQTQTLVLTKNNNDHNINNNNNKSRLKTYRGAE